MGVHGVLVGLILCTQLEHHICSSDGDATPIMGTNYSSGPFVINYNPQGLPTLKVTQEERLVWFTSSSNRPFVFAEKVIVKQTQIGGNYVIKHNVLKTCTDLEMKAVGSRPPSPGELYDEFFIQGTLCDEASVQIAFKAIDVTDKEGKVETVHMRFSVSMEENSQYNHLRMAYGCEKDEGFYGFGAQYSKLNMKGQELPVFLSEQGVGRGLEPVTLILDAVSPGAGGNWHTTYTSVPQYITSHHRSLFLESLEYVVFDMTKDDTVTIRLDSNVIIGRIIAGTSPLELITSYTALVGRLPPLPEWVGKGAVLGLQGGTEVVMNTISNTVEKQWGNVSDVAGVWLQDWTGQRNFSGANDLPRVGLWWNWEVDEAHYPQWTQMITTLGSKGIRTLTYINALFSNVTLRGTPFQHNYYEEGLEKGYFVRSGKDGQVWRGYSGSVLVDLSNPQACQWMVNIISENMLATGVCGWMCDFGESIPLDAVLHDNHTPSQFHSMYPSLWGRLNAEAIAKASSLATCPHNGDVCNTSPCPQDEVVYFMRAGNALSPSSTRLFWLGDQMVTWDAHDGLATVVMGLLSQGLSGYSLSHSDIGGYTALYKPPLQYIRSKELYLRWCELAAFSCMYRSHLGTLPSMNWQFDSDTETIQHFFKMAVVFQSWGFYRQQLMKEASEFGWPVIRHMMLVFTNNSNVYKEELTQQFMVGREFLVAPVLKEGEQEVAVFLPQNTFWIQLWGNGTVYAGNDHYVKLPAPIGQPCVLYKPTSQVGAEFVRNLKIRNII